MPEMDGHVANYPVAGKTGCPVIISKYSEAEKIKERMKLSISGFLLISLEEFQFRWLKIKEIYAVFPILITLSSKYLN